MPRQVEEQRLFLGLSATPLVLRKQEVSSSRLSVCPAQQNRCRADRTRGRPAATRNPLQNTGTKLAKQRRRSERPSPKEELACSSMHAGSSKTHILVETESIVLISLAHSLSNSPGEGRGPFCFVRAFLAALSGRPPGRRFLAIRRNLNP